ncbi:prepilin-type N-terminal cleavage/methylation domain-containing protein [Clostridium nigeriense]|uniref:prepilin-type N-terminal cleavage/methylation domain-containing protein n=1 Tax=Clostridium nigeriense TaxID=1805470 RepID=UPI00082E68F0|nr:prepilin-type N-terminal cleavage/methylation domain-containing protein [Clostridium nigeriense]
MLKNLKNKKKKKGFTLIELIIVIAIIAILAVLAIPKFGEIKSNANFKSDIANAKTIANAATTLIADGENLFPTAATVIWVDGTKTENNKIEEYLQNTPSPKSSGYAFYKVTSDNKGNITVTMEKSESSTTGSVALFPNPATAID